MAQRRHDGRPPARRGTRAAGVVAALLTVTTVLTAGIRAYEDLGAGAAGACLTSGSVATA